MTLVVTALAVLWVWEYLLILSPIAVPPWAQPALVLGCALGARHVATEYLSAMAAAGAVAVLHRLVVAQATPHPLVVRRRRLPDLRP